METLKGLVGGSTKFHHNSGPICPDPVHFCLFKHILERFGVQSLAVFGDVVSHNGQFIVETRHAVFTEEQSFAARTDDPQHVVAGFLQDPSKGEKWCNVHSTPTTTTVAEVLNLSGVTKQTGNFFKSFANFQPATSVW